jgi:hypothetical protein
MLPNLRRELMVMIERTTPIEKLKVRGKVAVGGRPGQA